MLERVLRHQTLASELQMNLQQAAQLEDRHREMERAIEATASAPSQTLFCLGVQTFVHVPSKAAVALLKEEALRVWEMIEDVQRVILKLERLVEEASEELKKEEEEEEEEGE